VIREFIKKVGTGPHGVRDLSRSEAFEAADILLSGQATPAQTGALLLGLRLKGESGEEMAGFLGALNKRLPHPFSGEQPDLDLGDPYDGRNRTTSLLVPAALYAARFGLRTVLHGLSGVPVKKGPGVLEGWKANGKTPTRLPQAGETLGKLGVACLSQADFLPDLACLLPIREELGLRTIFNTVEKAVNPLMARVQLIGVFHEPVLEKLRAACLNEGAPEPGSGLPSARQVFVQGVEGGVDLYTHRPTMCYITDPDGGTDLLPLTIPACGEDTTRLLSKEHRTDPPTLRHILETHDSPLKLLLDRQTAFFLFVSGCFDTFSEALSAVSRLDSLPIRLHRDGGPGHA
jgi:anthranilate phosphoribosyltransferase